MIFIELHKCGKFYGENEGRILINPEHISAITDNRVHLNGVYFDVQESYDTILERMKNYADVRDKE